MSNFYALINRMKYIRRWCLMRANYDENLFEHAFQVAVIAHALALIKNKKFGGNVDADFVATAALFHDSSEVITGDMPTPVKYYSKQIRDAFNCVEDDACKALLDMIPEDLREEYKPFFIKQEEDRQLWKFVKAADKICAYTKCVEEAKAGNHDFDKAAKTNLKSLEELDMPEVRCFMEDFLPSYSLTLDEMN